MNAPVTDPPGPSYPGGGPSYPGGADSKAYAFTFQVWVVLFLIIICFGLLNFVVSRVR